MYKRLTYFVCFCLISNLSGTLIYRFKLSASYGTNVEQRQPPEGDEATTGTMSPLAAVHHYLSTNSAKSTFLRNSGLVVKVTVGVKTGGSRVGGPELCV